ncbi:MAG: hypothetical protein QOG13_1041 [Sphingomonadales bacterium]|nr:hypothetical protein [Sphingomonadales bacterium]
MKIKFPCNVGFHLFQTGRWNRTRTPSAPKRRTDEPASSRNPAGAPAPEPAPAEAGDDQAFSFATPVEDEAYWKGVRHGLQCVAPRPPREHKPRDWDKDLSRPSAAPPLTRDSLAAAYTPLAADALGRAIRFDGFTPDRQRLFLAMLAACGVVGDACRAAGISRDTAYALRNRADGRAFAVAWNAAILIARGPVGDELMSRAMNGVVERVYRNGELWGERHRHDNRLAMAVLTRLDRQAEGMGEGAPAARIAAQEWDQFLDVVEAGGEEADLFFHDRTRPKVEEPPLSVGMTPDTGSEAALLARLASYRDYGVGLPVEVEIDDLDPEEMESWTEDQWNRAEYGGLLAGFHEREWPEAARNVTETDSDGDCRICQDVTGPGRLRAEYARRFPAPDPACESQDDGEHFWEDEDLERWLTDYPPPEGFGGFEEGEWGEPDYRRTLSPEEQVVIDADLAEERAEEEAGRAEALAAACAARDRAFGFAGDAQTARSDIEPPAQSDITAADIREGDSE